MAGWQLWCCVSCFKGTDIAPAIHGLFRWLVLPHRITGGFPLRREGSCHGVLTLEKLCPLRDDPEALQELSHPLNWATRQNWTVAVAKSFVCGARRPRFLRREDVQVKVWHQLGRVLIELAPIGFANHSTRFWWIRGSRRGPTGSSVTRAGSYAS
jgi:hypothetical protein